jgi:hypothetical protein
MAPFGDETLNPTQTVTEISDPEPDPWAKYPFGIETQISKSTAALSVAGSLWIIIDVLRDRKKRQLPYYRILLGLSSFDFISSLWMFLGSWMFPTSGQSGFEQQVTPQCEASGFFAYWAGISIPLVSSFFRLASARTLCKICLCRLTLTVNVEFYSTIQL